MGGGRGRGWAGRPGQGRRGPARPGDPRPDDAPDGRIRLRHRAPGPRRRDATCRSWWPPHATSPAADRARLNGKVQSILRKGTYSRDDLLAEVRRRVADRAPDQDRWPPPRPDRRLIERCRRTDPRHAQDLARRRQRDEPRHALPSAGPQGVRGGHRRRRPPGAGDGQVRAFRPDPDGPVPARDRRLGGDPSPQGRPVDQADPPHRPHRPRHGRRPGQGLRSRLRRL